MLSLENILSYYPPQLHHFQQFIFKEYLQYLILKIIFSSKHASKLAFLWGTNLRIIHENMRFSEGLDFDNFWLTVDDFDELSRTIKIGLESQWFEAEIKNVYIWAYRCSVRIPNVLKSLGFSSLDTEKILIQIDAAPHDFLYKPERVILNKFWWFFSINTTPLDIIASQKIYAIFNRKRTKWRDFFDLIFILWKTLPNQDYLKQKLWFSDLKETKEALLKFWKSLDFVALAHDVESFLFEKDGINSVLLFSEYVRQKL